MEKHRKGQSAHGVARAFFSLLLTLAMGHVMAQPQAQESTLIRISGQVTGEEKDQPLPDVSVQVKGTVNGTVTDKDGRFLLRTRTRLPLTLVFSSVGFR